MLADACLVPPWRLVMLAGRAGFDASHWRGSPCLSSLKNGFDTTPRSEVFRLPGSHSQQAFQTFRGLVTAAPPALFGVWRLVGFRTVTAPVVGFLRCPAIAFSPLRVAPNRLYRLP